MDWITSEHSRTDKEEYTQTLNGLVSYWTDRAHSYSEQNIEEMNDWRRDAWRDMILSHAPNMDRLRILDVGTGPGFFAMNLALAGHDVTAVDVTEHMLAHARSNALSYGADVRFVLHRGESLPFEDGSFDLIVNRNVLWNLEFPDQALADWARVLSPGGRMVYFDANWYLYLYDRELCRLRKEKKERFYRRYPHLRDVWNLGPKRTKDLEEIALSLPLSREQRPEWDRRVLEENGMRIVEILEKAGRTLQDPIEFERDDPTQMFMICAQKE